MVSLIFATYNGGRTLPSMLRALAAVEPPAGGMEVIAVDNGSTDDTKKVLLESGSALPIRYLAVPERGKNKALNAALDVAAGDPLVFTDDDVLPHPQWLTRLCSAANDMPGFDIIGGAIVPVWPVKPAPVIVERVPMGVAFGVTDPSIARGEVAPGLVWGANMLVRRRVFDAGLRFDGAVGPAAGNYKMGSETEFNVRAAARGFHCAFEPGAVVGHIIRLHQLERSWILARAFRYGRNLFDQEVAQRGLDGIAHILGMPRWRIRKYAAHRLRSLGLHLTRRTEQAVADDWEIELLHGYMAEWLESRRRHSRGAAL